MNESLTSTVFYALEKSIKSYRQVAQANLTNAGIDITIDQWLVLKTLQDTPDASQQRIAVAVFKDFASITRIIQLLVDKNYVRRTAHATDGRRSTLTLTKTGQAIIGAAEPIIASNRRSALRRVSRSDLACARRVLDTIAANCNGED